MSNAHRADQDLTMQRQSLAAAGVTSVIHAFRYADAESFAAAARTLAGPVRSAFGKG